MAFDLPEALRKQGEIINLVYKSHHTVSHDDL